MYFKAGLIFKFLNRKSMFRDNELILDIFFDYKYAWYNFYYRRNGRNNLSTNRTSIPKILSILLAADGVQSGDQSGGNSMGSDRASNSRISASNRFLREPRTNPVTGFK